jgi:GT2 family glycosyltransferase
VEIQTPGKLRLIWLLVEIQIQRARRDPLALIRAMRGVARLLRVGGPQAVMIALRERVSAAQLDYAEWIRRFDTASRADIAAMRTAIAQLRYRPVISLVVPVYNTPKPLLVRCIESVRHQYYPHWELCIADDASSAPHVRRICREYAGRDQRVRFFERPTRGHISAASNSALELATGDFVGLLDHDDELAPHALYMVADAVNKNTELDLIFSDEDKIDERGNRFEPWFKTDWNYDLMLSQNVVVHLAVFRREIANEIGGFRSSFEGSQDYDFTLRFFERTRPERVHHLPFVLYHWRTAAGSVARAPNKKSYAYDAAQRAIQDHLNRCGRPAIVTREQHQRFYRVRWLMRAPAPSVSIIIPTRDRVDLLRKAVSSILEKTDYPNCRLIIVNNRSIELDTHRYLDRIQAEERVCVLDYDRPYNYAALNNWAVAQTDTPVVALLNNDIEIISSGWLTEMVSHVARPEVGAVGAKLYYPDETVQHAGIVLGFGGSAGHPHVGYPRSALGYFGRAAVVQQFSAVTAACMVLRRDVFEELGGFDAERFAVAFNDVDLCLRIRNAGYSIVWTPYSELYHHESASLGPAESEVRSAQYAQELANLRGRWGEVIANDPFYNLNLTLLGGDFRLAFPPRVIKPWRQVVSPARGE